MSRYGGCDTLTTRRLSVSNGSISLASECALERTPRRARRLRRSARPGASTAVGTNAMPPWSSASCACARLAQGMMPSSRRYVGGGNAAVAGQRPVYQHRHAEALQQKRQQRQQIRLMARAVVARQYDRLRLAGRRAQSKQPFAHRAGKTEQFRQGFRLHAQRDENGAEFEFRHAAVQHGAEQLVRVLLGQIAGALRAAADFLDVVGERHKFRIEDFGLPIGRTGSRRVTGPRQSRSSLLAPRSCFEPCASPPAGTIRIRCRI